MHNLWKNSSEACGSNVCWAESKTVIMVGFCRTRAALGNLKPHVQKRTCLRQETKIGELITVLLSFLRLYILFRSVFQDARRDIRAGWVEGFYVLQEYRATFANPHSCYFSQPAHSTSAFYRSTVHSAYQWQCRLRQSLRCSSIIPKHNTIGQH